MTKLLKRADLLLILTLLCLSFAPLLFLSGRSGAVYADMHGDKGVYPAQKVTVRDTTGAGDAFCAGVAIGLTYKKSMREAVEIGTRLAASVITASENVCPRFRPRELGLDVEVES